MKILDIQGERSSRVILESGCFQKAESLLAELFGTETHYCILTDDRVAALYGNKLASRLSCPIHIFPHGEQNKTMETWRHMLSFLAREGISRNDCVIALGGGVCGDLAGFAAASRQRGVHLVQIPTSLLAMVDSSIGGKTGFDFEGEKNSIGAFYAPELVLIDDRLLSTLPREHIAEGKAEIIKSAMIMSHPLFERVEEDAELMELIESAVTIKVSIVQEDERDRGRRRLLNFGHTFAHALEEESGFTLPHGQAVACGMVCATRLSEKLGFCSSDVRERLCRCLLKQGLPVASPLRPSAQRLFHDKKNSQNKAVFILPYSIGQCGIHSLDREQAEKWFQMAFEE